MSFRMNMKINLVLKIKEFQGRSLIRSWTEAIKDFLYTKYLARRKLLFVSVVLGTPSARVRKGGGCQTLRESTFRFCYGWEMIILLVIMVQLPGVGKVCLESVLYGHSFSYFTWGYFPSLLVLQASVPFPTVWSPTLQGFRAAWGFLVPSHP